MTQMCSEPMWYDFMLTLLEVGSILVLAVQVSRVAMTLNVLSHHLRGTNSKGLLHHLDNIYKALSGVRDNVGDLANKNVGKSVSDIIRSGN